MKIKITGKIKDDQKIADQIKSFGGEELTIVLNQTEGTFTNSDLINEAIENHNGNITFKTEW